MNDTQTLYQQQDGPTCSCPIHADGEPPIVPLGHDFAHRVTVEEIAREAAEQVYRAHHSYRPDTPSTNIVHHGIFVDGHLAGAITWRQPLLNGPKYGIRPNGQLTREYDEAVDTFVSEAGGYVEAARICIGVRFQNLASCGLARSMERFLEDHAKRLGATWLLTYIRNDHVGSMLKALYDKGWQFVGLTRKSSPPSNREEEDIHHWRKQRWVFPVADYRRHLDEPTSVPAPKCYELREDDD